MQKPIMVIMFVLLNLSLSSAQPENLQLMRAKTEARLKEITSSVRGAMGLAVIDLQTGERFGVNENLIFPQGSAIKIPILMEVFKQAQAGKFKLSEVRPVVKNYQIGGSGVLQFLGDSTSQLSIRDLGVLMIVLSDNTATNILIDLVGMANINQTLRQLGLQQTRVQRRMINPAASARGEENLSTPAEAARIMEILYQGEFINRAISDEILAILKMPKSGSINAALPADADIPVAFKPGGIAGVSTEWAIVYLSARPYIVTIMENYAIENEAENAMKEISRTIYDYFWRLGRATKHGTYVDPEMMK